MFDWKRKTKTVRAVQQFCSWGRAFSKKWPRPDDGHPLKSVLLWNICLQERERSVHLSYLPRMRPVERQPFALAHKQLYWDSQEFIRSLQNEKAAFVFLVWQGFLLMCLASITSKFPVVLNTYIRPSCCCVSVFTLNMHYVRTVTRGHEKASDLLELEF